MCVCALIYVFSPLPCPFAGSYPPPFPLIPPLALLIASLTSSSHPGPDGDGLQDEEDQRLVPSHTHTHARVIVQSLTFSLTSVITHSHTDCLVAH